MMNESRRDRSTKPAEVSPATFLSVLSNEIRLEVLISLSKAEKCVTDVAMELELDPSTISHALQSLRQVGLVEREVNKKRHIYRTSAAVQVRHTENDVHVHVSTAGCEVILKAPLR